MAALWISHVTVTDPEAYAAYGQAARPAIEAAGGRFIARRAAFTQLEGRERPHQVIARFDSVDQAVACYNSAAYQAAHALAEGAAERELCVVETSDVALDAPGALWIAHVSVSDEEAYGKYAKLAGPAVAKHGGDFIARGGHFVQLEGVARPRNVVAVFPSLEAGVTCYRSPDYQQALSHARGASDRELLVVEINA